MTAALRKHGTTIVVAMVTAMLVASGPAIAATVVDYARNAGKVDGKSAVGAAATPTQRAGKLVATNKQGYLPGTIIKTLDWSQLANAPAGFADGTDDVGDDWNSLTNVPAGFADGTDDAGPAADWNSLPNIPAGFADGTDDKGDDWNSLTNVPGGFADGTDNVGDNWYGLSSVPAGFADGSDDVGYYKGTQITNTLPLGANHYWFTFGYAVDQLVVWRAVPTTNGGKVKLDVETEASGGTLTYYLRVTNIGPAATDYQLIRYTFTN